MLPPATPFHLSVLRLPDAAPVPDPQPRQHRTSTALLFLCSPEPSRHKLSRRPPTAAKGRNSPAISAAWRSGKPKPGEQSVKVVILGQRP